LAIVVPCYNEEEVLPETATRLTALLEELISEGLAADNSGIYFIDDGSRDATWSIIRALALAKPAVHGIRLSRNRGHQNALEAGLFNADGDVLISIDADLQDDITVMRDMMRAYHQGAEIVFGVRKSRYKDTWFKRESAQFFYRLMKLMGVELVFNHADYRLMSRRAVDFLHEFSEVNLFLRGIIPLIGLETATVHYDRHKRFAGESKYPLRKQISLALNGITSFSVAPLRMITVTGITVSSISIGLALWALSRALFSEAIVPGWTSTVVPLLLLGGVQILALGVIGEYLAKTYMETKRRPRFFIAETTRPDGD